MGRKKKNIEVVGQEPANVGQEPANVGQEPASVGPENAGPELGDDATNGHDGSAAFDAAALAAALDKVSVALEATERERDEAQERLLRMKADFDNYRRRSRNELGDAKLDATAEVIGRWLPLIENLERAHEAVENDANIESLREGVGLVHKSLVSVLEQEGVTTIDPSGERYDEHSMEAIGLVPHPDVPEGHVIEVFQRGRLIGDRLIQPARVIVSDGEPRSPDGDAS